MAEPTTAEADPQPQPHGVAPPQWLLDIDTPGRMVWMIQGRRAGEFTSMGNLDALHWEATGYGQIVTNMGDYDLQPAQPVTETDPPTLPTPTLGSLTPNAAVVGGPDVTLVVAGTGFNSFSRIIWNGAPEPTTFVSATRLETIVKPSTASGPIVLPVLVRTGNKESNVLNFTFTATAGELEAASSVRQRASDKVDPEDGEEEEDDENGGQDKPRPRPRPQPTPPPQPAPKRGR